MAQLDNATDSDSGDRGFKSLWAGQNNNGYPKWVPVIIRPKGFEGERGNVTLHPIRAASIIKKILPSRPRSNAPLIRLAC